MIILVIGGGGREHALAWKCAQSARVERVLVAPGNAGTALEPRCENVAVRAEDIEALLALAQTRGVGLTIVGPEAPLVAGIVDRFRAAGLRIFGPDAAGAQMEGSKDFTKAFLARHNIPTAAYRSFTDAQTAQDYIRAHGAPVVIKADGLAAGKGVTVAHSLDDAIAAVQACLAEGAFGDAGRKVVVEDFLAGEEASFICIVGGGQALALASSQDHKARDDGDAGPNTGGMGAYSPAPVVDDAMHARIMRDVIEPTVRGLASEGIEYSGVLYAGLMIGDDGVARVIEYNCRLGDPETQPILMRLKSDFVRLCEAALDGALHDEQVDWDPRAALGVVMAAGGYPASYRSGDVIHGLGDVADTAKVFHAGTRAEGEQALTAGGRVLCVVALGANVAQAQASAYREVARVSWQDAYYRHDIGYRAIDRQ
ncbi:MAG: phosphoribosylamine--glycine ligase [Gammaproteobacteria bacterium]|jgi:phosphoribosylamine--glycine ligase